jgi:putative ABC transport system permease protein
LYIDGAQANGKDIGTAIKRIDENYLSVLHIPILSGRNFSRDFPSDTANAVIVNEAFAKEIGWNDPVGKEISLGDSKMITVVGVVRDYHFQSLHDKIMPLVLHCGVKPQILDEALVKIRPDDIPQTIGYIQETFKKLSLFDPFQYNFLEQLNANEYASEQKWKEIISDATALSILISCMGLFGLTSLAIVRRTKEIGIRKVLGASAGGITFLVLKDFIKLVMIAFIISIPFTWYSANKWLENFAYRIGIEWWVFLIAGLTTMLIALLTISLQTIKAAIVNPIKSLRTE